MMFLILIVSLFPVMAFGAEPRVSVDAKELNNFLTRYDRLTEDNKMLKRTNALYQAVIRKNEEIEDKIREREAAQRRLDEITAHELATAEHRAAELSTLSTMLKGGLVVETTAIIAAGVAMRYCPPCLQWVLKVVPKYSK